MVRYDRGSQGPARDRDTAQQTLLDLEDHGAFHPIDHSILEPNGDVHPVLAGDQSQLVHVAHDRVTFPVTVFLLKTAAIEVGDKMAVFIEDSEGHLRIGDGPVQTEGETSSLARGQSEAARVI